MRSRLFILLPVVTMEMTDLLDFVCDVYCDFVTFQLGILGQGRYFISSIPDPCCLSYFYNKSKHMTTTMR